MSNIDFRDIHQVLKFCQTSAPTRAKSPMLHRQSQGHSDAKDIFPIVLAKVHSFITRQWNEKQIAFKRRYLDGWPRGMTVNEICAEIGKEVNRSGATVKKWCNDMLTELEEEFYQMGEFAERDEYDC